VGSIPPYLPDLSASKFCLSLTVPFYAQAMHQDGSGSGPTAGSNGELPGDPERSGNGEATGDIHASPDATLGGYFRTHDRPPAFEGIDGQPYTVSPEVEKTGDLRAAYHGYLVFPRWAETGLGVVGHVETPTLFSAATREEVEKRLGEIPLVQLKMLLDEAIGGRGI